MHTDKIRRYWQVTEIRMESLETPQLPHARCKFPSIDFGSDLLTLGEASVSVANTNAMYLCG